MEDFRDTGERLVERGATQGRGLFTWSLGAAAACGAACAHLLETGHLGQAVFATSAFFSTFVLLGAWSRAGLEEPRRLQGRARAETILARLALLCGAEQRKARLRSAAKSVALATASLGSLICFYLSFDLERIDAFVHLVDAQPRVLWLPTAAAFLVLYAGCIAISRHAKEMDVRKIRVVQSFVSSLRKRFPDQKPLGLKLELKGPHTGHKRTIEPPPPRRVDVPVGCPCGRSLLPSFVTLCHQCSMMTRRKPQAEDGQSLRVNAADPRCTRYISAGLARQETEWWEHPWVTCGGELGQGMAFTARIVQHVSERRSYGSAGDLLRTEQKVFEELVMNVFVDPSIHPDVVLAYPPDSTKLHGYRIHVDSVTSHVIRLRAITSNTHKVPISGDQPHIGDEPQLFDGHKLAALLSATVQSLYSPGLRGPVPLMLKATTPP